MANFNKVMLMGNLTRDPELKYTPKGTAVAEIGLAVNRTFAGDNGESREETTFVDITLWGRVAEIVGEYGRKGKPLFVEGRLQLDSWDDRQTGQKRTKVKVIGENIQLLGGRDGHQQDRGGQHSQSAQRPPARQQRQAPTPNPDLDPSDQDEIPFA